jgi:hypothetical protein
MDNTETQAPLGTRQNKEKHQTNKPRGKYEWATQRHRLHWEQDRTKRNTKQINRGANLNGQPRDTYRHYWEQDGTKRNTKQINKHKKRTETKNVSTQESTTNTGLKTGARQ